MTTQPKLIPEEQITLEFEVFGHPEPQGSTRAFIPKGWARPIITSTNKNLKSWRQELAGAANKAVLDAPGNHFPIKKPRAVALGVVFYFAPPQKCKDTWKATRPDVDKLLRAIQDGLAGIVYDDDAQIASAYVQKIYGQPERAAIEVRTIAGD